jgi:hypothetical protein
MPERLHFEYVFPRAYMFTAAPFARAIVPVELAKRGDEQVVTHSRSGEYGALRLIDDLASLPSVSSIVADRIVAARRPLPQIRELLIVNRYMTVDQITLSNLPNLVSLCLGPGWQIPTKESSGVGGEGVRGLDQSVMEGKRALRELHFHALAAQPMTSLESLTGLEQLLAMRLFTGMRRKEILGFALAGEIEAVGEQAADAQRHVETGRKVGNVVLAV